MSWGALAITAYADSMGTYCENIQVWLDKAKSYLSEKGLADRFYQILGIGDVFNGDHMILGANVSYPVDDIDRQLAVLSLAMATGARFEFTDGKYANGWIQLMAHGCENNFEADISEFLTPAEMLQVRIVQ